MPWRTPLPKPIMLIDGRVLETLLDARELLSEAHPDVSPSALRALELLLEAARDGRPSGCSCRGQSRGSRAGRTQAARLTVRHPIQEPNTPLVVKGQAALLAPPAPSRVAPQHGR